MRFKACMISCPQRDALRGRTLENLRQTDWSDEVAVVMDTTECVRRQERIERTALRALQEALASRGWDYLLFLEDDLTFNHYLRHNLEGWEPLQQGIAVFASLYNPRIARLRECEAENYFIAPADAVYGAQAFLLQRDCAAYIVENYRDVEGMHDIKFSRLAGRLGPIYYHLPSLVQHVGVRSAWGGHFHYAADFDASFKAGHARRPNADGWQEIPGWFDFADLYDQAVARAADGDELVEVGCWLGRSTAYLASRLRASGKRVRCHVVDHFRGSASEPDLLEHARRAGGSVRPLFEENMRRCGCGDLLRVHEGDSAESAALFADRSLAFVFIDADHAEQSIVRDITAWLSKVRPGGWLAGHDYYSFPSVARAVERLLPGHRLLGNCWIYEPT